MASSPNGFIGVNGIGNSAVWNLNEVSNRIRNDTWAAGELVLIDGVYYDLDTSPIIILTPGRFIFQPVYS